MLLLKRLLLNLFEAPTLSTTISKRWEHWASLQASNDNALLRNRNLRNGDTVFFVSTKAAMLRTSYSQIIHNRGQLRVYLRLLNIPVPGS